MTSAQLHSLHDSELMMRVANGDVRAFEAIYDRHRGQAFGLAVRITGRWTAAEEVTQDAFLSLWRGACAYEPSRASLRTWLLTLVRNRGIDSLRSEARHGRTVQLDNPAAKCLEAPERTEEQVAHREESRHARRRLGQLPAEQREVIELAYFSGLTQAEIAAKVGIPLGTVKGRSRLAIEKLRQSTATDHWLASNG